MGDKIPRQEDEIGFFLISNGDRFLQDSFRQMLFIAVQI
jgi:hypothetical protein